MGLHGGLTDIAGNEAGAVDLDQMPLVEQAKVPVNLGEQPGDCRFSGSRPARENHVQRDGPDRHSPGVSQRLNFEEVCDRRDLSLDPA